MFCQTEIAGESNSILRSRAARRHLHELRMELAQYPDQITWRGHHLADVLLSHRHPVEAGGNQCHARQRGAVYGSDMKSVSKFAVVLVTAPVMKAARKPAKAALEARLSACDNLILKIEPHYRWRGEIERGKETLLVLKTKRTRSCFQACQSRKAGRRNGDEPCASGFQLLQMFNRVVEKLAIGVGHGRHRSFGHCRRHEKFSANAAAGCHADSGNSGAHGRTWTGVRRLPFLFGSAPGLVPS